jgi:hypothetical protein
VRLSPCCFERLVANRDPATRDPAIQCDIT